MSASPDGPTPMPPVPAPEPGYCTTEFWVTLITLLMPLLTLIFHKDFSGQIQVAAVAAAAVASAVYALARSLRKAANDKAAGSQPVTQPNPVPSALNGNASSADAALAKPVQDGSSPARQNGATLAGSAIKGVLKPDDLATGWVFVPAP